MPVYLSEPYQKTGFVVLYRRIATSVMAGFLNKVILLLPQCMNIAQEQTVVPCREPSVLKMARFLPDVGFENALNFNEIFCMNVQNTFKYQKKKIKIFLITFIIFYYFLNVVN